MNKCLFLKHNGKPVSIIWKTAKYNKPEIYDYCNANNITTLYEFLALLDELKIDYTIKENYSHIRGKLIGFIDCYVIDKEDNIND